MEDYKRHPCRSVDIEGGKLVIGKLYTYREGSLKATIKFLEDLSNDEYFIYRILFVDGKYKDKEIIIELTREMVGSWGMWYIYDYFRV